MNQEVDVIPCSFAQQRLWFLDQFKPGDPAYNIPVALHLTGAVDASVLEQCLNEIVRRHESLRTTFTSEDGRPSQVIYPELRLKLFACDLRDWSDPMAEARALVTREAGQPFDLLHGPLLRTALLRTGDQEYVFVVIMHHIISDGWSIAVFINELASLYEAFTNGRPSPLAELPIQYADYALWQKDRLQEGVLQQQLAYWKKQLAGNHSVVELPSDHSRHHTRTSAGAKYFLEFPPSLTEDLRTLARQEHATLFMVLLAAFKTLLFRYSKQDDITVGSSIAGRNWLETEGLIGFFLNTLVLRSDLSGDPSFRELLGRVRQVTLDAYSNQEIPVEMLLEALQPERQGDRNPLFQVMFILQNTPAPSLEFAGLKLRPIHLDGGTAKFDLTLDLAEGPEGLKGWLEYSSDLFEAETIERLVTNFQTLLGDVVQRPERSISELELLAPEERMQVIEDWNRTERVYEGAPCIHKLFEAQAARTPEQIAVVSEQETLSYEELNARANQLAHLLRRRGVGPEVLVGLMLERSTAMVVALLGVLKAGGAYVPLDSHYPAKRLSHMLKDSSVAMLLTQQSLMQLLPEDFVPVLCLDGEIESLAKESRENPASNATSNNLAYVIYTSGSTGRPKGVMVAHASLVNYIHSANVAYQIRAEDRVLQFASLSFDTSLEEIFPCLTQGATLVLRTEWMMATIEVFLEYCAQQHITVLNLPTAYWHEMTRPPADQLRLPASIRLVIIGGEKALAERVTLWRRQVSESVLLFNTYGPTEATIVATMQPAHELAADLEDLPIGRPIANAQTYILDAHFQPLPVGAEGELYIGGACLARGYLNTPDVTAARFVPDPFATEPGRRLYQTGDLARYSPDGVLHYEGRSDEQVKIRGFRIETGEIEATLRQHPSVSDAVIIVGERATGDKHLIGYVTTNDIATTSVTELRSFVKERLPDHMLPSWFVILDAFPLTTTGKLDKRALPAPNRNGNGVETVSAEPGNQIEEMVEEIWVDVLGLDRVGTSDNFFESGGHSLLATQVISRVRQAFDIEVPLRSLFESPTIKGMATNIEALIRGGESLPKPSITRVSRDQDLPLSFAQERLWFLHQLDPDSAAYHVLRPLRITGALDVELMERTLTEVMRRHEVYRTVYPAPFGRAVQFIQPAQPVRLSPVDLRHLPESKREEQAQRLITAEGVKTFDLEKGPLWRLLLIRLSDQEHILMLTEHHMVHDGWTEGALVRDFLALYAAFSAGQPSPLPELPIQYADFAYWQREWLKGETLEVLLSFWKEHLHGAPPRLALPTDRPRPPVQTFRGGLKHISFSPELTGKINDLNRREGVTMFMTLLAAFQTLLHRYSRQDDIVVGTSIANRNWIEIEKLTGFFVNTLPLRTSFSGNPSFRGLLKRVRDVSLVAYAHQDLPFEKLVEELQPGRDLNHQAIFQVMFILQNAPLTRLELPELTVELLQVHNRTSKFDLLLSMIEQEGALHAALEYSTDLFDDATIDRMLRHFETLLEGAVEQLDTPIAELPLLTPEERQELLYEWNSSRAPLPVENCIHELFETSVARFPNKIAVRFEDESLTYQELNGRANQLARHLIRQGAGPGGVVSICVERSLDMLVAVLGVLKSGAAYLPLDPGHPPQRTSDILADARVSLHLTDKKLKAEKFEPLVKRVYIDAAAETISRESNANLSVNLSRLSLAYVIYTSGSTGKPKGVLIPHCAVTNFLRSMSIEPGMTDADVLYGVTTLSFDIAGLELLLPLTVGGSVVIANREAAADGMMLQRQLARYQPTIMQATPATWRLLIEAGWEGSDRLKILCGGEALPAELARELNKRGRQLWNMYGPTETTIWSTVDRIRSSEAKVTLGRPIANTQVYLLDSNLEPVPVGVPGDLYIGGDGLAYGYHNRPDLTAERFIPDPFADLPGARLYNTGDLARYLPDGRIEYCERLDHQVKIRGFRIELGEIESVLRQHPAVADTAVTVRVDSKGEKSLVSYVTRRQQAELQLTDEESATEQISHWQMAWNQSYKESSPLADSTFNIAGWNSSYTGLPIPAAEMREWREGTVERILALRPQRVLEIGCGTGLLLFRIAPHCTRYVATDMSPEALRYVGNQLAELELGHVELLQRTADDLFGDEFQNFDTIILNSVIQYFPNLNYLLRVIEKAKTLLSPQGRIFIGDVRSFPLLETFHTSVQFHHAAASLPLTQLRQSIKTHVEREEELTVDPAFFHALRAISPDISAVEVQLRRGRYINELTRFRYDVVLRVGVADFSEREVEWFDWRQHNLSVRTLEGLLSGDRPEVLGVSAVPNRRIALEVKLQDLLLSQRDELQIAADLRQVSKEFPEDNAIDPEDLWVMGDELGYSVEINWSSYNGPGSFDALFKRRDVAAEICATSPPAFSARKPWSHYGNDPLKGKLADKLARQLRQFSRERLPDYMMPSAFVVLDSLPRTPNGKLDRRALPDVERVRSELRDSYVAPRTETEEGLARIWSEVLGIDRIGIRDSFFDLGGHSLLATQVLMRVREAFQIEVPLRNLFATPTIEGLAIAVLESEAANTNDDELMQLLAELQL